MSFEDGIDLRAAEARIEGLLAELSGHPDGQVVERAEELVGLLVRVYGAGLARVVAIAAGRDPDLVHRFAEDDLVGSLLMVHGLHPLGIAERVQRALDAVRPYLGSHAGGVELLGVDEEGVVRLRLEGSCDGCPSSTVTVKLAIERAITEAAPEVVRVDVEGLVEPAVPGPKLIPVESLRQRISAVDWQPVPGLQGLREGEVRGAEVAGAPVVVCRADGELLAYRDACASCGASLVDGSLVGDFLACPGCASRFDVRHGGSGTGGLHLDPLPLLASGDGVRIAAPSGALA
jgi:Fe-S cluster biogenesis protein NfuA/nitrite reductase/ring-hydroxylating ferredoxin subunit